MAHLYRVYLYWWNTGHRYVGKTYQGSKRIGNKTQYQYCVRVYRHWNIHGDPNIIQLLEDNIPSDKISEREQYWVKEYDAYAGNNPEFGLNLTTGGEHCELSEEAKRRCSESKKGKKPYEMTDEIRKHMSISKMGSVPWNKGKPWDEEFVKEMSERQTELMKDEEFKQRCLVGLKKYHKEHPEACRQVAKEFMGKQENRELVSRLTKEAMQRPEVREKILKAAIIKRNRVCMNKDGVVKHIDKENVNLYLSQGWKLGRGKADWNNKKVLCIDLNTTYKSITEASEKLGIGFDSISACLNGRQKTAGKKRYKFKFVD